MKVPRLLMIPLCGLALLGAGTLATEFKSAFSLCCEDAARRVANANLKTLDSARDEYAQRNGGRFPQELSALVHPDEDGRTFTGLHRLPLDPWKREYYYQALENRSGYVLFTLGRDGEYGGLDADNSDLVLSSIALGL